VLATRSSVVRCMTQLVWWRWRCRCRCRCHRGV
jgi:hypothetical protein